MAEISQKGQLHLEQEFAKALWTNNSVCKKLYNKNKSAIPKYKAEILALQLIAFNLVRVVDKKVGDGWESYVALNCDGLKIALADKNKYRSIKLL